MWFVGSVGEMLVWVERLSGQDFTALAAAAPMMRRAMRSNIRRSVTRVEAECGTGPLCVAPDHESRSSCPTVTRLLAKAPAMTLLQDIHLSAVDPGYLTHDQDSGNKPLAGHSSGPRNNASTTAVNMSQL
ncbi:hypothetical protein LIA77_02563 [Sarocladium implicatum]|nr:hypothetical protein LIA77_02563 [Sarocladium implicatum]